METNFSLSVKEQSEGPKSFFVDGHVDLPYYMKKHGDQKSLTALENGPFTLQKAKEAGISLFCTALYCEDRYNGDMAFNHFQDVLDFTLKAFGDFPIFKDREKLEQLAETNDAMGTVLLLENADVLASDQALTDTLIETGIRMVGLTHGGENRLADGNMVSYSEGIKRVGKEVIRIMAQNGLIIDVAHLHEKCFWQLLDLTESPIITSHTGIKELCNIPRNIDMHQVQKICERKGLIGLSFNPEMLSPDLNADVHLVFAHMDTLVQKVGPDCIGIGSDFCGYEYETHGLEDISGISNLMAIMSDHGYGNDAITKIMGLNWLGFYKSIF